MVLGTLLGRGASQLDDLVPVSVSPERVLYVGLIEESLRDLDQDVRRLDLAYASPEEISTNSHVIQRWIQEQQITKLAIHLDLDVLSPHSFYGLLPNEPGKDISDFPAAVGRMTLQQVVRIISDISDSVGIVGLSLAEYMPWDALQLRDAFEKMRIFTTD